VKNVTDKLILLGSFKSPGMILHSKDTALYPRNLESSAISSWRTQNLWAHCYEIEIFMVVKTDIVVVWIMTPCSFHVVTGILEKYTTSHKIQSRNWRQHIILKY